MRTDRPTTSHLDHSGKISNGNISARDRPIHFMFGSMVGFSGSADRMALFPVSPNPRWRRSAILENSNGDISAVDRPIYSVFGARMFSERRYDREFAVNLAIS